MDHSPPFKYPAPAVVARKTLVPLRRDFVGDDRALVEGLRLSCPNAHRQFFDRYASTVERVITHVIGLDRDLADIIQDTFLQAIASIHRLKSSAALRHWLIRIATNCARKAIRTRARRAWLRPFVDSHEELQSEPAVSADEPDLARAVSAVYRILNRIATNDRIAFALRYIEAMELTETALASGVSVATVKRRLKRAELRFAQLARHEPALADWLLQGSRWKCVN